MNYLIVSDYRYNIYGTIVSGAAGYLVILVSNYRIYKKYSEVKLKFSDIFIKPLVCSAASFLQQMPCWEAFSVIMGHCLILLF